RGHTLEGFLARAKDGVLPVYHVRFEGKEHWFHSKADVDAFVAEQSRKLGKQLVLADLTTVAPGAAAAAPAPEKPVAQYVMDEWHEVRGLNRVLGKLREAGFEPGDLIASRRVAGREPPVRFALVHGDVRKELLHLLTLVAEIRRLGEKGITVTRFKGLGEMDPEELWETTLNPQKRTLLRVTLTDAEKAEKLFRTLMGEAVEDRKAYIFEHGKISSLEDIDYG